MKKIYYKDLEIKDIFGRPLKEGDFVLHSLYYNYEIGFDDIRYRVCISQIVDSGLHLFDGETDCPDIPCFSKEGLFVYKLEFGEEEMNLWNQKCDITELITNRKYKKIANRADILKREGKMADFVLYVNNHPNHNIQNAGYGILVGEKSVFNGKEIEDSNYYYIISCPTADELIIKEKIVSAYNEFSQNLLKQAGEKREHRRN